MKNEKKLLQKLKQGDQIAFEELYNIYSDRVYFTAIKFNFSPSDAEELVQEVFLTIWELRSQLNPDLSFKSFILTTAKNRIINQLKRKTYDITCKTYFKKFSRHFENSTEDYIIFSDLKENTDQFIESLPEQRKQILILRRKENLSPQEIAEKLGISKRTVENNIYKADKAIRDFLGKEKLNTLLALVVFESFLKNF